MENSKAFFEELSANYDAVFRRLVSPFPTMLQIMFDSLPPGFKPNRVLELGCGTGNLTKVINNCWPDCELVVVDLSRVMLEKTRDKTHHQNLRMIESSFVDLEFDADSFELVTSSLAIHHLLDPEKITLFRNIHRWLRPGGVLVFNDCVRAESQRLYQLAEKQWIDLALEKGLTRAEMDAQIQHHRQHDHYPVLIDLANWLKEIGFTEVDILWRFCIWGVLYGSK